MTAACAFSLFRTPSRLLRGVVLPLALVLTACAPRSVAPPETAPSGEEAAAAWNAFEAFCDAREAEEGPYRLRASLRFGKEGDSRRATLLFWSNGTLPVRLDVMAGVNSVAARLLEDRGLFVAYSPGENKAFVHEGRERVRMNLGKPVPLSLGDVAALTRGNFRELFGRVEGEDPRRSDGGTLRFRLRDGLQKGDVDLTPDGTLVRWAHPDGWVVRVAYDDETPPSPRRIDLEHPDGYAAVLLVKDSERPAEPFPPSRLALEIPEGTAVEPIKNLKTVR